MVSDEGIKRTGPRTFAVRVYVLDGRTGRRVNRKATVTGSMADARRVRAELLAEAKSTAPARRRLRLSDYAASWLELRAERLKPSVAAKYGTSLERHVLPVLGDLYLDTIAPTDVREYVAARLKVAQGNTVLNELRLLRTIARDAKADGLCETYWCDRVSAPPVRQYDEERPNLLDARQLAALMNAIPRQWAGIVALMATTGLRWGEASGLRWEDLDVAAGAVRIRRQNWRGQEVRPKTKGSARVVALLPEVARMIGPQPARAVYVFPTASGKLHRGSPLRKVLDVAMVRAKLASWAMEPDPKNPGQTRRVKPLRAVGLRVTPHGLRRTFNDLARRITSGQVLRSITGHATEAMSDHYSLVGIDEKRDTQRQIGQAAGLVSKTGKNLEAP